jgi:hypothetical protein
MTPLSLWSIPLAGNGLEFPPLAIPRPAMEGKLCPSGIGSRQRVLCALRYRLGFIFRHAGHVDCQVIRVREIDSLKRNTGFHEGGDEGYVAGHSIQLSHQQRGAMDAAERQSAGQLRPIAAFARFDLYNLFHQLPASAIQEASYRLFLCFQPKTAPK